MKIFLNPGHAPNGNPDPGACGHGLRECDIAKNVTDKLEDYLTAAGVEVVGNIQSDNLSDGGEGIDVIEAANNSGADIFVSVHCNAASGNACGTETLCYDADGIDGALAEYIQTQIVDALNTEDRGVKERHNLAVINGTDMPAVLVELAFITNEDDAELLRNQQDDFAAAIARGITDFEATES